MINTDFAKASWTTIASKKQQTPSMPPRAEVNATIASNSAPSAPSVGISSTGSSQASSFSCIA